MKENFLKLYLLLFLILVSCAGHGSGIMVQFDSTKPLDQNQLERHCDMEDSAACLLMGKPVENLQRLPVIQGVAPVGRVIFAVLMPKDQKALWYFREEGATKLSPLQHYQSHSRPHSLYRVDQLQARGLKGGITYELIGVNALGQLLDHRTFQTLSPSEPFRFALISGTDDHSAQADLWADLSEQKPQLILALGNNVYSNSRGATIIGASVSPEQLWDRYSETRARLPIFTQVHLIPIFATWNDRDFGMVNGDNSYPHVDESRRTMEAFFPYLADAKSVLEGPGISRGLKIAGQTFLLFDNRSFRSAARAREPSYLGRIQEDWAVTQLRGSNGPLWFISGEKWFGKKTDSFESAHPGPFVNFLAELAQAKKTKSASKIVFAGGAQSRTEIRKIPSFSTYEFNSGFQSPAKPIKAKDAKVLTAASGGYMILETKGSEIKAQIRSSGGVISEKNISLKNSRR